MGICYYGVLIIRLNTQVINPPNFQPPEEGHSIYDNGMRYLIGKVIGQGYYGKVYKCEDEWGNDLVAKVLIPRNQTYEEVRKQWLEELNKLLLLCHQKITFVDAAFEYCNIFYLIIERCHFTLNDLLKFPNLQGELWLPHIA